MDLVQMKENHHPPLYTVRDTKPAHFKASENLTQDDPEMKKKAKGKEWNIKHGLK